MSEPKPAKSTPEEAAFHEAGHCYVAIRDAGRIVNWMEIGEDENGWGGTTDIAPDYQNLLSWTTITVAGIAAEARADANRRFKDDELMVTIDLVERVKDYVEKAESLVRRKEKVLAVQINFLIKGNQEAVSAISISDVRQMTQSYRDRLSLQASLGTVVSMCESKRHWPYIEELAKNLLAKGTLSRAKIEKILGLR